MIRIFDKFAYSRVGFECGISWDSRATVEVMAIVIRESLTAFKDADCETLLIKLGPRDKLGLWLFLSNSLQYNKLPDSS